jgi:hypothetical protein
MNELWNALKVKDETLIHHAFLAILQCEIIDPNILDTLATFGRFFELKELLLKGVKPNSLALDLAAINGHLDVVRLLCEFECDCTIDAIDFAASKGYLDIVKFLHSSGKMGTHYAAKMAAFHNQHDVVTWLLANTTYTSKQDLQTWMESTNIHGNCKRSNEEISEFTAKRKKFE